MINAILAADVMGFFICIVILYGNSFESSQNSEIRKRFSILIHTNILILADDFLSYVLEGKVESEWVLYALNIISNAGPFIIASAFGFYIYSFVKVRYMADLKRLRYLIYGDVILSVVIVILCLTKRIFYMDNGIYTLGPNYTSYLVSNALLFLAILVIFVSLEKIVSKHDFVALFSYIAFPSLTLIVEFFVPELSVGYPAFAIMSLMIYVMLQSDNEKHLIEYGIRATHNATHDELTGLLNRRAYAAMLEEFKGERRLGVIYCDVNGLKYANDNHGHKAGDEMLRTFAGILISCCRKEETFRIGGDEFVVLLPSITEEAFWNRVHLIESRIDEREIPIASLGAAFGVQKDYASLIEYAENEMYMDKKQFYADYPKYARE